MDKMSRPHNAAKRIDWPDKLDNISFVPLGDVFIRLNSKRDGLSEEEAMVRLKHFGRNEFPAPKTGLSFKDLARQFFNPFALILFAVLIFMIFAGMLYEAGITAAVIFLMGLVGFCGHRMLDKKLTNLKKTELEESIVLRDGIYTLIPSSDIVPGDVVLLRSGDRIPADARIAQSYGFKTVPLRSFGASRDKPHSAPLELHGVCFGGSFVSEGMAEAVVFGTGRDMEIVRTERASTSLDSGRLSFDKKIYKLGKLMCAAAVALVALVFAFGLVTGRDSKDMAMVVVAVAVASVPGGLLVITTLAVSVGINRISYFGGLVRSVRAPEDLSGISVIVTDISSLFFKPEAYVSKILTPERRGGILEMGASAEYAANHILTLTYGFLASEAVIENRGDDPSRWTIHGGRIDKAIIRAAVSAGIDIKKISRKFKRISHSTFGSARRFALTFQKNPEGEIWAIAVGSPDILLPRVKKIQVLNRFENAIPFETEIVKESVDLMSKSGLTVLAVCSRKMDSRRHPEDVSSDSFLRQSAFISAASDLNLVGLMGVKNDVYGDAANILPRLRRAGIRTIIVTGGQTLAAKAAAAEIGIVPKNKTPEVLEGFETQAFDSKELARRIGNIDIFSRTGPEQKLKIIEAWMSRDAAVAFVGGSPTDAGLPPTDAGLPPADVCPLPTDAAGLKRASLGVSVSDGADISKEFSDLILGGNKLKTLFLAIREGRAVFENIRKNLACLLGASFAQVILIGLGFLLGWPLPITAIQILWINFVHEFFPVLAISVDPPKKQNMDVPPRDPKKPAVDKFLGFLILETAIFTALILFGIFYFFDSSFDSAGYAETVTFAALGANILFAAFSIRCLKEPLWNASFSENKILLVSAAAGMAMLAMAVYFPPLEAVLKTQPIGVLEWIIILCSGILNVLLMETGKWIFVKKMLR